MCTPQLNAKAQQMREIAQELNRQIMNREIRIEDDGQITVLCKNMKVTKKQATGVLGTLLAQTDERQQARTRAKMIIAARIEDAMTARNLNQKQFARLMGRSESEISSWLSGERNFTLDTLTDISIVLRTNLLPFAADASEFGGSEDASSFIPSSCRSSQLAVAGE